ncbi:hypothetical protein GOZ91_22685 [Agrobacterium vitis]|nr:hypothetical protein [Agrobacterium vitis]
MSPNHFGLFVRDIACAAESRLLSLFFWVQTIEYLKKRIHDRLTQGVPCNAYLCFVHITRGDGKISTLFSDNGTRAFNGPMSQSLCASR